MEEFEHGAVAFFDLESGLRLALWPRASLAHDSGLPAGPRSPTEFCLAHNVAAREEVGQVMAQAQRAGATLVKAAHDTFYGGYAGYFQDPDGHLWEVAFNPGPPVLEVAQLTTADRAIRDVSLSVRAGEIVGMAGLIGASSVSGKVSGAP